MKALYSLLIVLLISECFSVPCYDGDSEVNDPSIKEASDCHNRELVPEGLFYRCCYAEGTYKKKTAKICVPVDKETYDDIENYVKEQKNKGYDSFSIDCGSSYIVISLLSIILLFL